jgi:hypothetical protein
MLGTFTVHGGDFKKGNAHQFIGGKLIMKNEDKYIREDIEPSEIEELEVASEETVKRIGGAVGWGLAGVAVLGPVGLLAGLLAGGKGKDVTFVCKLKDGRRFLATAPSKVYNQMLSVLF